MPSLTARADDPKADRVALESLAVWADRFSPCVHIEGDDTLLLDVSGCHRLFPDEEALLQQVVDALRPEQIPSGSDKDIACKVLISDDATGRNADRANHCPPRGKEGLTEAVIVLGEGPVGERLCSPFDVALHLDKAMSASYQDAQSGCSLIGNASCVGFSREDESGKAAAASGG